MRVHYRFATCLRHNSRMLKFSLGFAIVAFLILIAVSIKARVNASKGLQLRKKQEAELFDVAGCEYQPKRFRQQREARKD